MRLDVRIFRLFAGYLLLFFLQTDAADETQCNSRANDAHHSQRIGTGISIRYGRSIRTENLTGAEMPLMRVSGTVDRLFTADLSLQQDPAIVGDGTIVSHQHI